VKARFLIYVKITQELTDWNRSRSVRFICVNDQRWYFNRYQ